MAHVGIGVVFNRNRVTVAAYFGTSVSDVLLMQLTPMGADGDSAYVYTSEGETTYHPLHAVWEVIDDIITEHGAIDDVRVMQVYRDTWAVRLYPPRSSYQFSDFNEGWLVHKGIYPKQADDRIEYQQLVRGIIGRAVDTDEAIAVLMAEGVMT